MKKLLLTLSILLTGFATANAQLSSATLNGNDELFLGFAASSGQGSTTNVVVDLGFYSNFLEIGSGSLTPSKFSTLIGNLSGALSQVYGSTWRTNPNLSWAIMGAVSSATNGDGLNTLYATTQTGNSALLRQSSSGQGSPKQTILSEGIQYVSDFGSHQFTTGGTGMTGSVTNEGVYFVPASEQTTWASGVTSLNGYFSQNIDTCVTNNLELYKLATATGVNIGAPGTDLGTYSVAAVPEPKTYALLTLSVIGLYYFVRRRRSA